MVICPVCEHPQERGAQCDVCGWNLVGEDHVDPVIQRIEGLEPTRLEAADAPAGPPIPGLER
jgi:methionyl-tRNA synthetase